MEIKVFIMLVERFRTKNRKGSIKEHTKYFNLRKKVQADHPVLSINCSVLAILKVIATFLIVFSNLYLLKSPFDPFSSKDWLFDRIMNNLIPKNSLPETISGSAPLTLALTSVSLSVRPSVAIWRPMPLSPEYFFGHLVW